MPDEFLAFVRCPGAAGRRARQAEGRERGAVPARSRRASGALIHKRRIRQCLEFALEFASRRT
jgi:hypothetical protein